MNSKQHRLISILLLLLGLAACHTALAARPVKISSAAPAEAPQGATLPVTINGSGFDITPGAVEAIKFLLPCDTNCTDDTGGVTVQAGNWVVQSTTEIVVTIDIAEDAVVEFRDIEVQMSHERGGKGTTLFKVQPSKNEVVYCMDEFFPEELKKTDTNVTCDCEFSKPGENWPHYGMQRDCSTSATLKLNTYPIVNPSSSTPDGTEMATLTAIPGKGGSPFQGTSVISNTTDKAGVRFLNIRFDPAVARGCDEELQSAISFVLDGFTDDRPENSSMNVTDITIDTNVYDEDGNSLYNDPLCIAVEILRSTPVVYAGDIPNKERFVWVENAEIADGSYEDIGIRVEGMQPNASINPTSVSSNYIGAPACAKGSGATAIAIQFGGILLSDPSDPASQIPGVVDNNIIHMENDNCDGAVGIRVVGEPYSVERTPDFWPQTTAVVVKNVISGAVTGVEVDCDVVDVSFSGNTLIGVPGISDFGIFSEALSTGMKGKPNHWVDYEINLEEDRSGCPPVTP